jgi:hypothetical protein
MRKPTNDGAPRNAFSTAPAAPTIRLHNTALDHRPIRLDLLPRRDEPKLV